MMHGFSARVLMLCGVAVGASLPGSAWAKEGSAAPAADQPVAGIADIIVTANRREEALQSVGTAITALDGDALREKNIASPSDLLGSIPSLNVSANGTTRDSETVTIRGQGQTYLAPVGVVNYFAEVPLIQGSIISNQGGPGSFFDLESLQVLRGPQGTLFGKNTTGGALLLGPKRPTNKFEGYVQAQLGNYNDREFSAAVNIPVVSDRLMIRAAVQKVDRDGYTKDVGTADRTVSLPFQNPDFSSVIIPNSGQVLRGSAPNTGNLGLPGVDDLSPDFRGKDYDDRHYWTARIGVLMRPADGIENYLVGSYTKAHNNGTGQVLSSIDTTHPTLINLVANAFGNPTAPSFDAVNSALASQTLAYYKSLGPRRVSMNADQFYRLKTWAIIDTFSAQITDNLTFRNVFGYQRMEQNYTWDLDGTYLPVLSQNPGLVTAGFATRFPQLTEGDRAQVTNLSQITEEPQLQGGILDGKMTFVLGGFYSKVKPEGLQATGSYNAAGYGGVFFATTTRSRALYAQTSLDLGVFSQSLDGLKLTGGLRHTWDDFQSSRISPAYVLLPQAAAGQKTEASTWTLAADYQMSSDVLFYGKATKGYKAGGFNYAAPRASGLTFRPENVMNYEIGAKTDLRLGGVPVRLNISAYQLNYKNIQRSQGDNVANGCPESGDPFCNTTGLDQGAVTYNIGKARVRGVELEAAVRPLLGFDLSGSYSYTKAKYLDYSLAVPSDPTSGPQAGSKLSCTGRVPIPQGANAPITVVDLSCAPFPFTPKNQFSITGRYELALAGNSGQIVVSGTYSHADRSWSAPSSLPGAVDGYVDGYNVVNASLDWNGVLGLSVDARFFVTNITNTTYRISNSAGDDGSLGYSTAIYNEPRMYGLTLRYRFGE